jgi:hypothetical protein
MTAILLLAAYLRIDRLDTIPNGLIPDEAMRGYDAYAILRTGADSFGARLPLFLRSFGDYTPALYSVLSLPFIAIFGLSAFSTRLAAAFIGITAVACSYQLIRRPFGRTAALAGAFLLAISPWHILPSRTGTEWNLLALGPVLAIILAYRGLRRPPYLIAAGIAGGVSLYGYAPIKIFLPLLLAGFIGIYRRELSHHGRTALAALLAFCVIATPIYIFSFTPAGLNRFNQVYAGSQTSLLETIPQLIWNYLACFSPNFLILTHYTRPKPPLPHAHLQSVGLLSWFEFFLLLLGLVQVLTLRRKSAWFLLYWLLVAPVGINLHTNSPWPILALTMLPIPYALGGAGLAWLLALVTRSQRRVDGPFKAIPGLAESPLSIPPKGGEVGRFSPLWGELEGGHKLIPEWLVRAGAAVLLGIVSLGLLTHFRTMQHDLFYDFPVYGAKAWGANTGDAIAAVEALKGQYDEIDLLSQDLASSIYLLFYTRYDPAIRQAELAKNPEQTWQTIGDYNLGRVEDYLARPGCHLILTTIDNGNAIKNQAPQLISLRRFDLPGGEPNLGLYAFPSPLPRIIEQGVVFGDTIMLQGFGLVSNVGSTVDVSPGQSICLILQWQALQTISTDYTVFVHLAGPTNPATNSPLWAQHDGPPAHGAQATSTWHEGGIILDPHRFVIPADIPSGQYTVQLGLYDSSTGERLTVQQSDGQSDDAVILMELNIQSKS